jgi:hypothetical protein
MNTLKLREFTRSNGIAWPGCYPVVAIMGDCECMCAKCIRDNYKLVLRATRDSGTDEQWEFSEPMIHWEGDAIICAHCGEGVESAYGNPEGEAE